MPTRKTRRGAVKRPRRTIGIIVGPLFAPPVYPLHPFDDDAHRREGVVVSEPPKGYRLTDQDLMDLKRFRDDARGRPGVALSEPPKGHQRIDHTFLATLRRFSLESSVMGAMPELERELQERCHVSAQATATLTWPEVLALAKGSPKNRTESFAVRSSARKRDGFEVWHETMKKPHLTDAVSRLQFIIEALDELATSDYQDVRNCMWYESTCPSVRIRTVYEWADYEGLGDHVEIVLTPAHRRSFLSSLKRVVKALEHWEDEERNVVKGFEQLMDVESNHEPVRQEAAESFWEDDVQRQDGHYSHSRPAGAEYLADYVDVDERLCGAYEEACAEARRTRDYLAELAALRDARRTAKSTGQVAKIIKRKQAGRKAKTRREPKTLPRKSEDGPHPPNLLRWKQKDHPIPPLQWRILNYMWRRDSGEQGTFEEKIWGEVVVPRSTVQSALSKLNSRLLLIDADLGMFHVKNGFVCRERPKK